MNAMLSTIHIYPVKSCAPLTLEEAQVEPRGLAGDRRWMLIDADGRFITGRKYPQLTLIRAKSDGTALHLQAPGMPDLHVAYPADNGVRVETAVWGAMVNPLCASDEAHAWLSRYLGVPCRLVYMDEDCMRRVKAKYDGKYGRDEDIVSLADAFPLLLISQAALDALNARLTQPVAMLRFRPNLVVAGTAPHAEDDWKRIRVGAVEFDVVKPCTRCVFTTVDFEHGSFDPAGEPLRTLTTYRRTPDGVTFGQNLIPRGSGSLRLGDVIEVIA